MAPKNQCLQPGVAGSAAPHPVPGPQTVRGDPPAPSCSAPVAVPVDQGVEHDVELIARHGNDRPVSGPRLQNVGDANVPCPRTADGTHNPRLVDSSSHGSS